MNQVVEELKSVPGVLGGCIFHSQKGIVASNLPSVFKEQKIAEMCRMLIKIYQTGRTNFSDVAELSVYYEESTVLIRESLNQIYLIIMCDPSMNINLLSMSMNMIMGDLDKTAAGWTEQTDSSQKAAEKITSVDELLKTGPLAKPLNAMLAALLKVMGPMAKIIFLEAAEEWLRSNNPSLSSLKNLVRILAVEIHDPMKISLYEKLIAPHLELKRE